MKKIILEIKNLTKFYGKVKGIEDLNLQLYKGEIFGLIGPNGAGKSTTIRSIMNLINKTSGEVYINGELYDKNNILLKDKIGYLPSEINLYDDYTVKNMLDFHESFYNKNIHDKRIRLVDYFNLDETKFIEDLSLGNKKKLGIILALMHDPEILILDEPTSGLDPIMQNKLYKLLQDEKNKGTLIFYSTHILSEVSKICDRVGIIKNSKLIDVFSINDLNKKSSSIVTIKSPDSEKILKDLKVKNISNDSNFIKFKLNCDNNSFISKLTKYDINKIFINETELEDLFLDYYKEDK